MNYSKGITWFDDCRIPFVDEDIDFNTTQKGKVYGRNCYQESNTERNTTHYKPEGRYPANLLCSDDMLNDGIISKSGDNIWIGGKEKNWKGHSNKRIHTYNDKGSNSRYYDIDKWFNKLLDELF